MLCKAMLEYADEQDVTMKDVVLCVKPSVVRAARDFSRGELQLVPYVPMKYIHTVEHPSSIDTGHEKVIDGGNVKFFIVRPPQPSGASVD